MARTDTTSRYLVWASKGYLLTDELLTHEGLICRLLAGEWDHQQSRIWEIDETAELHGTWWDVTDEIAFEVAKALFEQAGAPAEPAFGLREWIEAHSDSAAAYLAPNPYEPASREYDGAYEGAA